MIAEAIRSLVEPEGSTEASISAYIKANFSGLPSGHDRLLPYYLTKLINNGEAEFVMGPHGRYHMPQAQHGDPNSQHGDKEMNVAQEPEPEPEKKSFGDDGSSNEDDEGVPLSCEGDLVMKLEPIPPTVFEPTPKRKGRPPKRRRSRVAKARDGEKQVLKKILPQQEHGAHKLVPTRSEWPPKRDCTESAQLVDPSTLVIIGTGVEVKVSDENQVTGSMPTPKRRGRPPKRNPELMDNYEAVVVQRGDAGPPNPSPSGTNGSVKLPVAEESNDGSKPVNKRRGRPPKRNNEGDVEPLQLVVPSSLGANGNIKLPVSKNARRTTDDGSEPVPMRLGRPPKRKNEPTDSSIDVVALDDEDMPTNRRRKSKKSSNLESGGDCLLMEPKDNSEMQQERKGCNPVPEPCRRPHKADYTSVPKRRGRPPNPKQSQIHKVFDR